MRCVADDGEAALLVRVEPAQVQVGGEAGREAQEAEHDVLDALAHVALAARLDLVGLLAGEPQQHRDVVRAERPQRVLVGAQLAEVQAVAVDVEDAAELAAVDQLLELDRRRGGTRAGGRPSACGPRARRRRRPPRRRRPTAPSASRRSSACRPPARGVRARRGSAPAWRARRRRRCRRPSTSSRSPVKRAPGNDGATRSRLASDGSQHQASSTPGSAASCARCWGPSSRGRRRRRASCGV